MADLFTTMMGFAMIADMMIIIKMVIGCDVLGFGIAGVALMVLAVVREAYIYATT